MFALFRRALMLLTSRERKGVYVVLIISGMAAGVQTLSMLSMMPFIVLLTNPDVLQSNEQLIWLYGVVGAHSYHEFLTIFGLFAVAMLTAGNMFVAFEQWLSLRFLTMLGHRIKKSVLENILQSSYERAVAEHSAKLNDIVLRQVERAVHGVIGTFVSIFSSMALAALIVLALLVISLKTTLLTMLGLLVAYLAIFMLMRGRISSDGELFTRLSATNSTAVKESLDGIREIKARRAEPYFIRRFETSSLSVSKLMIHFGVMNFLPYYLLETVVFAGFVLLTLYSLHATSDAGLSLSYLALYGMAVYRLVPAMRGVFEGVAEVHHDADAVQAVLPYASNGSALRTARTLSPPSSAINVRSISFNYAASDRTQLDGVEFSIPVGSSVCLFGPSGSGKSTILNLIAGLLFPQAGVIEIDATPLSEETVDSWLEQIGYSPQQVFLFDDTLSSNIAFGIEADKVDQQRVMEVSAFVNLHDHVTTHLPHGYQTVIAEHGATLSGGQRQRVGIARALYHDPDILIFDESFASLDAENRTAILDRLFALQGKTLIFSSHEPAVAARCDKVLVIEAGRLIEEGRYDDLVRDCPRFLQILSRIARDQTSSESPNGNRVASAAS